MKRHTNRTTLAGALLPPLFLAVGCGVGEEPTADRRALGHAQASDPKAACQFPAGVDSIDVCVDYGRCCDPPIADVAPSACAMSLANSKAVCECSSDARKVRCEQTTDGTRCHCE